MRGRGRSPAEAATPGRGGPAGDLAFAKVDLERAVRTGTPEVTFGPGKTPAEAAAIARLLWARHGMLLATRLEPGQAAAILEAVPEATEHPRARLVVARRDPLEPPEGTGRVVVVPAGTADEAIAEEAALTAGWLGSRVERVREAGVAGLSRVLGEVERPRAARCVVAVAGMDGALPSVVAGLVAAPVVALPNSIGYGAAFAGLAALLAMLNACAPGVGVVNIDNGFGAGVLTHRINVGAGD